MEAKKVWRGSKNLLGTLFLFASFLFSGCKGFLVSRPCFRRQRLSASNPEKEKWWKVEVSSEFDSPKLYSAHSSQSLLALAERAGLSPSSECRRGNCLSCAARLLPGSTLNFKTDDVFLCNDAKARGYILACSSYVTGPGLKIELEKNHEVAAIQYYERFASARLHGKVASAQSTAAWAMDHPEEWQETVGSGDPTHVSSPLLRLENILERDSAVDKTINDDSREEHTT